MAWTNTQKALVARACAAAGIADEHRRLIVAQVPGQRAIHQGRATTTSPRLTQEDFEWCMATIEDASGGQIKIRSKRSGGELVYRAGHWQQQLHDGPLTRLRHVARAIDRKLQRESPTWLRDGESLRAWIAERLTGGRHSSIERLDYKQLTDLIHGLKAFARRNGYSIAA